MCGQLQATWGVNAFGIPAAPGSPPPAFVAENFERVDLDKLARHQLCKNDATGLAAPVSSTVSFRRKHATAAQSSSASGS